MTVETEKNLGVLVDRGGLLDAQVKESAKEVDGIKKQILAEAASQAGDGEALELVGNTHRATVSFSAELGDELLAENTGSKLDAFDEEAGRKLFPWSVHPPGFEFTEDEVAVWELKKLDQKLFKRLFKTVKAETTRAPDAKEINKALHDKTEKRRGVREFMQQFVKQWIPKSVSFSQIEK